MNDNNVFTLDLETLEMLINSRWEKVKIAYGKISPRIELEYKTNFIKGYHAALTDMHEITSGAVALDEILKNDKQ